MNHDCKSRLCSTENETSRKWIFWDDLGKKIKDIHDTKSISSKLVMQTKGNRPSVENLFWANVASRNQSTMYKNVEDEWK